MAGTITALVVQKKNKTRVNVFLDGEFAFGVSLDLALPLKKGTHLSDVDIAALKEKDAVDLAYQQALNYLAHRARSSREVAIHLKKKGAAPQTIEAVLTRLTASRYLDDQEFAQLWVNDRVTLKPKGRRALRYELRRKGLPDEAIETAISDVDDTTMAWRAVQPKLRQWQALPPDKFRQKLTGFLSRRGFDYQTVRLILEKAGDDEINLLDTE